MKNNLQLEYIKNSEYSAVKRIQLRNGQKV